MATTDSQDIPATDLKNPLDLDPLQPFDLSQCSDQAYVLALAYDMDTFGQIIRTDKDNVVRALRRRPEFARGCAMMLQDRRNLRYRDLGFRDI